MGNLLFRKKFIIGLIVTLVLLTAVSINYAIGVDGPKVKGLSLQEATELALKNNPDLELAKLAVDRAQVEYDAADDAAYILYKSLKEGKNPETYELGKVLSYYPVLRKNALTLAEKQREFAEKKLMLDVEIAYYNVLKADKSLAIKREGLKYIQDQLKIAQTGYKIGTRAKIDVTSMEANEASYQAQVTSGENDYRKAVMELDRITGLDLDTPVKLTTQFTVEKTGNSIKLDETIKEALADNLDILRNKKSQESNEALYKVADKYLGQGATSYDTALIDVKIGKAGIRKQELATTAAIKQSYLTIFNLEKSIDWQTKEVEKAKENARVFSLKYNAGLATALEVRDANISLEKAQESLFGKTYDYNILKSQFKYGMFSGAGSMSSAGAAGYGQ